MSWLSKKWDELTGKNQKVGLGTIKDEYNAAFQGARDAYGNLQDTGEQLMDAGSQLNLNRKAQMEASAADSSAEGARQAQRLAAMGGGGNTASLTAQTMASGNKAQAGAIGAFNEHLQGALGQGAGMVSGAANNMAQMNQTQMNAVSNQRLANAQIDSQATGFGAQMFGLGLSMMGGPGAMLSAGKKMFGLQEGGYAESPYGNRGGMLSQVMGPDGIPVNIRTRIGGQYIG